MSLRPKTWRVQIVLLMILVSGISLGIFIVVFWPTVRISNYKRFDAELTSAALKDGLPFVSLFHPQGPRPRQLEMTKVQLDGEAAAFSFRDLNDGRTYQSGNWPDLLDSGDLSRRIVDLYVAQGMEFPEAPRIGPDRLGREGSAWRPQPPPGAPPPIAAGPRLDRVVFDSVEVDDQRWRVLGFSDGVRVFVAVQSLAAVEEELADFSKALLMAVPVALVFVGLAAWVFAGRAIAPVKRLIHATSSITAQDLDIRLDALNEPEEFADLIKVYNAMLDRLEKSFEQAGRFSADAAHEQNTPLMILKGHLDELLQSAEPESLAQQQAATAFEESKRLQDIIAKLLTLSQADSGRLPFTPVQVDFSGLILEILQDVEVMAPELTIDHKVAPSLHVKGDYSLLRQCVFNLFSNAIKYNRPHGFIRVALSESGEFVRLEITNAGEIIPVDQADRLFDRFYRADPSRNPEIDGRGLGLSLAHEFARVHDGQLSLQRNDRDAIAFRLDIPVSS
ncbi:HAMP domain-containing protein [Puniceicoccales bacterium CK1056]|uniref:histidine kinase n=1 Tax=Oceanipulchritudo coccoides TaxID=2706888 RepID=A0A6B2M082_9BACT|nr:ATP-binding protein [Oceanipulchritudo coccoides]NDV61437.1 HAMP domain-containing protein [Oceanipulchritudo coccoides]